MFYKHIISHVVAKFAFITVFSRSAYYDFNAHTHTYIVHVQSPNNNHTVHD